MGGRADLDMGGQVDKDCCRKKAAFLSEEPPVCKFDCPEHLRKTVSSLILKRAQQAHCRSLSTSEGFEVELTKGISLWNMALLRPGGIGANPLPLMWQNRCSSGLSSSLKDHSASTSSLERTSFSCYLISPLLTHSVPEARLINCRYHPDSCDLLKS